jgi:2-hydroxychromene-2-carboxylate isomerase
MGDLIYLSTKRGNGYEATAGSPARTLDSGIRFYFALDCPLSYLAAERVERALGEVVWVPVLGPLSEFDGPASCADRSRRAADVMRQAERESRILRMPLVRPRHFPLDSRRAARAATLAAERGACQSFALAIARLAFCGGFDISKESAIRNAAEVAGLDPEEVAGAASDPSFDRVLDSTSLALRAQGADSPPAISIGEELFDGPDAILAATTFRAARVRLGPGAEQPRQAPLD